MNDILEQLGFELTDEASTVIATQTFASPHELAETLVDLKVDAFEAGYEVASETIQGNNIVCTLVNVNEETMTITQSIVQSSITVVAPLE